MRWGPAFAMALLAFACERFETAGSPPSAVDASPAGDDGDAAAIDASAPDGSSSSVLLLSADFEGATGGECGGKTWDSYQSTSDVVAGGRVGTNACRFCGDPGETGFTINSPLFPPARTGKIVGHAWFRLAAPGSVNAALVIRARPSRVETNNEGMHVTTTTGSSSPPSSTYPRRFRARISWTPTSSSTTTRIPPARHVRSRTRSRFGGRNDGGEGCCYASM